jgi:hypothetical protein
LREDTFELSSEFWTQFCFLTLTRVAFFWFYFFMNLNL